MSESIYKVRMNDYYPEVVRAIEEFRAIIDAEYPEFDDFNGRQLDVVNNAYLLTMDETRVKEWEAMLNITPVKNSTLDDRRETIIARIRGQGKLNRAMISNIVNVFTGGTANSYFEDSTLFVEITPPPDNKQFLFENVAQELRKKIPAHINLMVARNYYQWGDVKDMCETWQDVHDTFPNWADVCLYVPFSASYRRR